MDRADPTAIAVAVVRRGDEVLIGRRSHGQPLAGLWEFPGGKVKAGESPSEAAARECREETGLDIHVSQLHLEVDHSYPHGRVKICFFAASPVDPAQEPRPPFRWVRRSELAHYAFPPANAAMLARLRDEGRGAGEDRTGS